MERMFLFGYEILSSFEPGHPLRQPRNDASNA